MSKKVVIIGGGLSSKHAAEVLMKKGKKTVEVTIIQANKFVEWPLAMTVCLVKPELHDKALGTDCNQFQVPGVNYKYAVVESVDTKLSNVKLADNDETVPFDALIIATGFKMPLIYPGLGVTVEARKREVQSVGDAIKKGETVVVAGGGPCGLELAGDIRGAYPNKKVVLACRNGVLGQWPDKHKKKVEAALGKMNIEIKNGIPADAPTIGCFEPGKIKFPDGELAYDVFLPSYTQGPNTKFLPETMVDGKGGIDVDEYLQSTVSKGIFAVGVSNVKEPFVGMPKLEAQWNSVTANIIANFAGKPMKKHTEGMGFMKLPPVVTIGHGPTGHAFIDFDNVPPPVKCCCCCGLAGFPCCPPCWPCCACGGCGCCPCGYCCGAPEGKGPATLIGKMAFISAGMHFKGIGSAPVQQKM